MYNDLFPSVVFILYSQSTFVALFSWWYFVARSIDCCIALLTRGTLFPIGVAKYLMGDHYTNWYQKVTCTHHLWTIPTLWYGVNTTTKVVDPVQLGRVGNDINRYTKTWISMIFVHLMTALLRHENVVVVVPVVNATLRRL